jgi:N-acetylneuraminic acid mutarotase
MFSRVFSQVLPVAAVIVVSGCGWVCAQEGGESEGDTIHVPPTVTWEKIADLAEPGGEKLGGYGGMFAGVQGDVLLLAGGTEFPEKMPWEGGVRVFSRGVHVLERKAGENQAPEYRWVEAGYELPVGMGCGASVSVADGLLCIGGATVDQVVDTCFLLRWNGEKRKVERVEFPKLPRALAWSSAAVVKQMVYVMGGTGVLGSGGGSKAFYALDLSKRKGGAKEFAWKALPAWEGQARMLAVGVSGVEGSAEYVYLCGGRNPGGEVDFLTDLHRYDPVKKDWSVLGDIVDPRGHPCAIVGAPAFHVPPHHLVVVSGTDETLTRVLEGQARDLANIDEREKNARRDYNRLLMEKFPGYTRTVLGYDAGIGEWNHLGGFPGAPCLTNPAVNWGGQVVIPGGETGPGRRSPEIWMGTVVKKPAVVEEEEAGPAGQLTVPAPGPEAAPAPAPAAPAPAAVPAPAAAVPAGGKPTGVRRVEKR